MVKQQVMVCEGKMPGITGLITKLFLSFDVKLPTKYFLILRIHT